MGVRILDSKKAVVFTLMAIVISLFFTLMFSARIQKPLDHETRVVKSRIAVLNKYMETFFDYAEITGSISAYSALRGIITDIDNTNQSNPEFNTQYLSCIRTGNLTSAKECPCMENQTLIYYLDKMVNFSREQLNINSEYIINPLSHTQKTSAFTIEVLINLTLKINDAYANITDTRIVTSSTDINGLKDPLYLLNGTYDQLINQTPLKRKEGDWKPSDLTRLYNKHEYRAYKGGISFINRIKANNTASPMGIESFVNHTHPTISYTANHSMTDYQFWLNQTQRCSEDIVEINESIISPPGFQIDDTHRLSFGISSKNVTLTC